MTLRLVYQQAARTDLLEIYDWIADRAGAATALAYASRIVAACERLTSFPRRGTPRDDLLPGLRTVIFERRATIAYQTDAKCVRIIGIFQHGRDPARALADKDEALE